MLTPPNDRRRYLLTFWPKDRPGELGMNYSRAAFAEFFGIGEEDATQALGAQDRSLLPAQLDEVVSALRRLLTGTSSDGGSPPSLSAP